jgi:glycosyltransferase involved in cell wall biosynthesis
MANISVIIITLNEEKNITRCISSVKQFADEVIVVDGGSKDATIELAENLGATVYQNPFSFFITQIRFATQKTTHDYVFCLDADEVVDEELLKHILEIKETLHAVAYSMNRLNNYCGQFIRHGAWYPDRKIRLFNKTLCEWGGFEPHYQIVFKGNAKVAHLRGHLLHYSYRTVADHHIRNERFSTLTANDLFQKNVQTNSIKLYTHPAWAFIHSYFIKMGFLDGRLGFTISKNIAQLSYLKHFKLLQLQAKRK